MLRLTTILVTILLSFSNLCSQSETQDSTQETTPNTSYMSKSPSGALWRSVIPGWGQLYNEEYWKAPILFGSAVGLGSLIVYFNSEYLSYSDQLEQATMKGSKIPIESADDLSDTYFPIKKNNLTDFEIKQLEGNKESFRDSRDMMAFYLLGVYIISAVDAYVGAHLYDFDVDDNIGYNVGVNGAGIPEIYFSYSF
ncbi:MAG: DUF5683 domain-containing protein [Chlorobiota bacterium]